MKNKLFILVALLAMLLGVWLQQSLRQAEPVDLSISFPDLNGKPQRIDAWKGKVLVVNFWASWCPACVEEMPVFQTLQDQLGARGLQFIGIAIDDAEAVKPFLAENPVSYPILIASEGGDAWALKLGNSMGVLPFTAVFDASGALVYRKIGGIGREELLAHILPLLRSEAAQH